MVVLTFASLAGTPLSSPDLFPQLVSFAWTLETTRILLISALVALVVAASAALATRRSAMAWLAVLTLAAVVILALTGHAAGSASHEDAVNALGLHLAGVVVWVGGLMALVAMRRSLGADLGATVSRYSTVAAWCFALVTVTGVQQAWIRLGSLGAVATAYGLVVALKTLALVALGVLGWLHRRSIATRLADDPADGRAFARLAVVELAVMGAATGLAAVLARSVPPVPDAAPAPEPRSSSSPASPTPARSWPATGSRRGGSTGCCSASPCSPSASTSPGVVRLTRRGDHWPVGRTICWVLGWMLFVWATSGAPGIWGRVLFSVHMVMHMAVAMIVPLLLVPGAPVTLALRTLKARPDKTWGPREVLLQVVHSRAMRALANPVVAAALFFFSLALFYWTGLFELSLTTHTGHLLMLAHFLLTGYLFTWVLIGIDPGVPRWSPLLLLVILFATISFHAFFGVSLTGSETLLAPDFFGQLNLPWGPDPLADQRRAGEIAWGVGEAPTLVLAVIVAVQWFRTDQAETRRKDRQADRDGDAELNAYNEHLARLREQAERQG